MGKLFLIAFMFYLCICVNVLGKTWTYTDRFMFKINKVDVEYVKKALQEDYSFLNEIMPDIYVFRHRNMSGALPADKLQQITNSANDKALANVEQKEKDIRKLEGEISALKLKLRKRAEELKREREKASYEESRRLELESCLQNDIDKLRKELDKVKGHLGQLRSAKNIGDEETKKLREREKQLLEEIEEMKTSVSPRKRKMTK